MSVDATHNISIEHSIDCTSDEPKVIIDVAQPPDTVKHVHQWLKYLKAKAQKVVHSKKNPIIWTSGTLQGSTCTMPAILSSYHNKHYTYWCTISASL